MIDREAVRNNANYLRRVRPIDPEEIAEYIEGSPHPAVVRETLREEAFDLRLREREDGTFVPVPDEPVEPPGWAPEALPEAYSLAVEDLLVGEFGANWHRGESGDRLRTTIRQLKADYLYGNDVTYDRIAAFGYAIYHLPGYYAAIGYVLDDLVENRLLDRQLRVLDVGAGVGGPALGLHDYLPEDAVVEYHAIEPSANAEVLDSLLTATDRNFRTSVYREPVESFLGMEDAGSRSTALASAERLDGPIDLVLLGNVLSELSEPASVVAELGSLLAADGSLLALAPADLHTATELREVERAVTEDGSDLTVYAPTLRLWSGMTPSDRGWSFDVASDLAVPAFQARLDEAAARGPEDEPGEFINVDVQFAYSILRTDGARRVDVQASVDRCAPLSASEDHVTDRVNLLVVKLSHDLSEGGNGVYKIGDGSQRVEHYAVCTRETELNRHLREADYGAVVFIENGLVLWNDDEEAYNVVVDAETVVDLVAP
ncbi:small ribosomal subunit Rsm22 family protein [Halorubrum vacuolatum]|uniref:small ribosomal subunit Rsm22 family protein n=1 Tax=Halorubrum vacuolatum TaxID=63740 RepID=UPI000B7776BE|nr:class I SAM-dependent methyltransferase [Halorubrum vacuolatum]